MLLSSSDTDSRLAGKYIPRPLRQVRYRVHNSVPLDNIHRQLNPDNGFSGMWCDEVWLMGTKVSEAKAASIIKVDDLSLPWR